jgi:hypothetical protein
MKIPPIAALTVVSLFFTACGHKSSQITSSSPAPSPSSLEAGEPQDNSAPALVADESPQEQAIPSPSPSASTGRPVFKSQAATRVANDYLNSCQTLMKDVNTVAPPPAGDLEGGMNFIRSYTQKIARDTAALESQRRQIQSQMAPERKKATPPISKESGATSAGFELGSPVW